MFKLFKQQRGAMFGLDARIALSIFAGLSVVTGVSMIQVLKDNRTDKILFLHQKVSDALDVMQEDLEANPADVLANTGTKFKDTFLALYDESMIAASHRSKWLGPYLREDRNRRTEDMYQLRIRPMPMTETGINNCTATHEMNGECYFFLFIGDTTVPVPQKIKDDVNEALDGPDELNPDINGSVRWDVDSLYIRMGLTARS